MSSQTDKDDKSEHTDTEEVVVAPSEEHSGTSTDELARFRREWEAEVKKNQGNSAIKNVGEASSSPLLSSHFRPVSNNDISKSKAILSHQSLDDVEIQPVEPKDSLRLMRRAIQMYAQAVENERTGQLDEALVLYRKAFRLDSNVDRLFERASIAIQAEMNQEVNGIIGRRELLIETEEVRSSLYKALNVEDYRYLAIKEKQQQRQQQREEQGVDGSVEIKKAIEPVKTGNEESKDELSALINRLSVHTGGDRQFDQIRLEREDEERPMPFGKLPEEVLLHILSFIAAPRGRRGARVDGKEEQMATGENGDLAAEQGAVVKEEKHRKIIGIGVVLAGPDYMSIEQLGRTCWKFRLLTRAWSVWRLIVRETYFPPQIPFQLPLPSIVEKHNNDWRTTFVEQPRVRLNGAYIAACHYTRPGVHDENVWIRVVHVVEFYRSLRFLPNGQALSLLTTDAPSQTVRKMEPSLRLKGFAIGTWTLHPQGLVDDDLYSRPAGPKIIVDDLKDKTMIRYKFRLILKLETTSRGKWNRMEVLEYESVNLESGEVCPLPLNHKKPFHFSTVRSYGI